MYLLDTDTIIYSLKNETRVVENLKRHMSDPKAISVISYGELVYGAEKANRRHENLAKAHRIAEIFPVIDISRAIMDTFGVIKADLEKRGTVVDDFDLIIAATAMSIGYSVVTNNVKHFEKIPGLRLTNWLK